MSDNPSAAPHDASPTPPESLLSPHRAFVVRFRVEMGTAPERFAGRVEHIVSGRATRFRSPEKLWAFFAQILVNVQD